MVLLAVIVGVVVIVAAFTLLPWPVALGVMVAVLAIFSLLTVRMRNRRVLGLDAQDALGYDPLADAAARWADPARDSGETMHLPPRNR